ncbi:MAG: NUDIX hydrolase [Methylocella sp.]
MSHIDSCAAREARPGSARAYPRRPYLGVSVAVFRAGRVLLARRTKPPYAGAFSLPGGLVEVGETLAAAALREVQEELQIIARIVAFNQFVESIECDNAGKIRHHYVIASFAGEWIAGEAKPGPEAREAVWVEPARLAGLDCTPHIVAVAEAAQRALNGRVRAGQP